MQIVKILLVYVLVFNLISCATIINGSTEKIRIFASTDDTSVYVNDVYMGKSGPEASIEITIPKKGRIVFVGKKTSCQDGEEVVRRSIDPATFLGLFIDMGIISILFVDILGTNAFVHANQKQYILEMDCRT